MARSSSPAKPAASPELLSLADLTRHFALPESTIRYYCRRFAPFFPLQGQGRRRKYHARAISVLEFILKHMPKARTAAHLEVMLREHFSSDAAPAPSSSSPPSSIEALQQRHEEDMARIERELQALRQLIITSERTQQEDLEQLRQWMGHYLKNKG